MTRVTMVDRRASRRLAAEHGVEMTPEQFAQAHHEALDELRRLMRLRGHEMPEDDEAMTRLVHEAITAAEEGIAR